MFSNSITLDIDPSALSALANINDVWYIEPIDPPSVKENKTGRTLHRSNTINTNYASGRHYNGEGINIMMQDDGLVGPHIDRQGRIHQTFCNGCSTNISNDHGDHVSGTIMGAGNLDPITKGMADGSFLYVYGSSNNNYNDVPNIYQNNDVVITSKSYSNGCNAGYTSLARDLDEQINLYPSLIHVFSAGNSGSSNCGYGAGSGWGNVTGGHKQAKNVIQEAADRCGMYYIVERWLGGTLTNFSTIKKSIKRLLTLEKESSPIYKNITKKESVMLQREKLKLSDLHRGIKSMKRIPSAIFIVDGVTEMIAIKEAKTLDIPTFGIIDSNTNPNVVDFPIPANDDSVKCIKLIKCIILIF